MSTTKTAVPVDDLFRGVFADGLTLRADDDADGDAASTTMYGHFALFDVWTEIDSWFEGRFLERIAKGAFAKTFKENRASLRVTFDHGYDLSLGDKPLGRPEVLSEDKVGAYYEVPLLDTDYNRNFILPVLEGRQMNGESTGSDGLLGASFRFRVMREEWVEEPERSDDNPDAIPERTIKEVRLYEFGPVVYPAYDGATAKVRSLTDHFIERRRARGIAARTAPEDPAPADPVTGAPAAPTTPATRHLGDTDGRDPRACLSIVEALRLAIP